MTTPFDRHTITTDITYGTAGPFVGYLQGFLGSLSPDGPLGALMTISDVFWNSSSEAIFVNFNNSSDQNEVWEFTITQVVIDGVTYDMKENISQAGSFMSGIVSENPFPGASGTESIIIAGFARRDLSTPDSMAAPLFQFTAV